MSESPIPEPVHTPDPDRRRIELEIEVPGTPEEVWEAIATGPGISSWYVPHTVEEREGGAATASFGPGPEMQIPGVVLAWEPPRRIVFGGGESLDAGLAFEWLVEARDQASCVVRLVNSGFGDGQPWDDQYDDMLGGWRIFLRNLWLHLRHFPGQSAAPALPMAMWQRPSDASWSALLAALGLPAEPAIGERIAAAGDGVPLLAGTVLDSRPGSLALLLDSPAPGTGFLACEGTGPEAAVSVWAYLYGPDRLALASEHDTAWREWLGRE